MSNAYPKKVFVSYSHDSKEHKEKVRHMADVLREQYNLNVIGDFYDEDNPAGGQLPDLMEKIRSCDNVLCILSPLYKIKANEGKGGVGYEKTIITDELFHNIGSDKFIPVLFIEDVKFKDCVPDFLTSTRKALLRSASASHDSFIEEIARSIWVLPKKPKPPLGKNKLLSAESVMIDAESIDIEEIVLATNYQIIFKSALFYAKKNDEINFRTLLKKVRNQVFRRLNELREEYENDKIPANVNETYAIADKFINAAAPLFLIAFAGYLSFNERFHNQEGLLIDLLTIDEWDNHAGKTFIKKIPQLLVYIYHHIYGGLNIDNDRVNHLTRIFELKIPTGQNGKYEMLYKVREVTGFVESLGSNCFKSFNYLLDCYQRLDWVKLLFENQEVFQRSIVCYQSSINLLNFFVNVKNDRLLVEDSFSTCCDIPPSAMLASNKLKQQAHHFLMKNADFFKEYLEKNNISKSKVINQWELWLKEIRKFNTMGNFGFWMFNQSLVEDMLA